MIVYFYDTFTVLAVGVVLVGQAAEILENCRFVSAVAVSHHLIGLLTSCWHSSAHSIQAPGKRGGGLLADRLGFAAKQSPGATQ
jgi:hypothetical protein